MAAGVSIPLVLMDRPAPGRRYEADKAESLGHGLGPTFPLGLTFEFRVGVVPWLDQSAHRSKIAYRSDKTKRMSFQ